MKNNYKNLVNNLENLPKISKIAQRLSLNQEQIDDPHIERLIQAFSLIAARIDKN